MTIIINLFFCACLKVVEVFVAYVNNFICCGFCVCILKPCRLHTTCTIPILIFAVGKCRPECSLCAQDMILFYILSTSAFFGKSDLLFTVFFHLVAAWHAFESGKFESTRCLFFLLLEDFLQRLILKPGRFN